MTDESPSPSLASIIGADTSIVHDASRAYLTRLLNQQAPIAVPDFSALLEHSQYQRLREQIATSTTLAALAGDARLEALLQQWVRLQQGYAKQVIAGVKGGVSGQQELLAVADAELRDGEPDRETFERLKRTPVGELDEAGLVRFQALKTKVGKLDQTAATREQLYRAVAGVSRVEQTLTTLLENSAECIHYAIPSVNEIQDRLGVNKYDGPDFQPFLVSSRATVQDIFARDVPQPSIRTANGGAKRKLTMDDLHPVLSELVRVYNQVISSSAGSIVLPSEIVASLRLEIIGAKGLASYLEDNAVVFGVQQRARQAGSRTFIRKETGTTLDTKGFLEYILDGKLQQADAKQVNEFYFGKALALLRERPDAHEGFTKEHIKAIADNYGLPMGRLFIARTLTTRAPDLGMKRLPTDGSGVEKYVFAKIVPTDTQLRYVREAVDALGINRFSPSDAVRKVHEGHTGYRIVEKVVATALHDHRDEWGLRVASDDPLQYKKRDVSAGSSGAQGTARKRPTGPIM